MARLLRARLYVSLFALAVVTSQGCDAPSADPLPMAPTFAKSAGGPSVSSANPSSGHQGDVTLDVTISGSGFDNGSRASWQLDGVAYPKITVNSTRFNSTTSLTANITIAADAQVTTYDIAVTTSTGKKGIGAEMFTVTYAIPLSGVTQGRAISDAGMVAGFDGSNVVAWTPDGGAVLVASNSAVWDIDRTGSTVGGKAGTDFGDKPAIWTSATGAAGSWVVTLLPDLGGGGAVRGIASDATGNAVLLTGNAFVGNRKNAVVWTKTDQGWQLRVNSFPPGVTSLFAQGINARGQVVGMDGSGCCSAFYWDSLGAATRLSGVSGSASSAAYSINGDGTIIVGNSGGSAALWRRTLVGGVYGPWSAAIPLDNPAALCGRSYTSIAYDVNAAGTIAVGSSCGIAVAWQLSGGTVTARVVLQGLGPPNQSVVYGINDAASPRATGSAKTSTGVYWWGF